MIQLLKQGKFSLILSAAGRVFALVGYRRAMMSDIAAEAGVALGTLYRYAESKEELFELALRRELGQEPTVLWDARGRASFESSLLEFVRHEFVGEDRFPILTAALEVDAPRDGRAEFESVLGELYDTMSQLYVAIRMIDRSASDWPELNTLFANQVRNPLLRALEAYLSLRCGKGLLITPPDLPTAARYIVETCATFAMHRHFTPGGNYALDSVARATAMHFISKGFAPPR
ncbi:MAG TPA: helix-turn-helix domain-containing protein [Gemmatimonadales bacterium]|nr:helix-turn-helix domain-containing protein [Gemmatimonadales bacterium]